MKNLHSIAVALAGSASAAAMFVAAPATAATVYDNGSPVNNTGNEATAWVQAEDFTLGATTAIGGAGVYLSAFGGTGYDNGGLQYYIFAGNGGTPGAVLASGNVTPTVTNTGATDTGGSPVKLFTFAFDSAFTAAANTTYFFGFHASGAGDFHRDGLYWLATAANGTGTGRESQNGTFNNWSNNGTEHAFYLTDAATAAVPEPATWGLMIMGFGLVGGAMRRRSTKVAFAA